MGSGQSGKDARDYAVVDWQSGKDALYIYIWFEESWVHAHIYI